MDQGYENASADGSRNVALEQDWLSDNIHDRGCAKVMLHGGIENDAKANR